MRIALSLLCLLPLSAFAQTNARVSVSSTGVQGSSIAVEPRVSRNGRFVTFASSSPELVAEDWNGTFDVFVHDRQTGVTERVSISNDEAEANADSMQPSISDEGRYVAFRSQATNLVVSDTNLSMDVFVRDRLLGTTTRVSVSSLGVEGDNSSMSPAISGNGRSVVFFSYASNLVIGDENGVADVFVHDLQLSTTVQASVATGGLPANYVSSAFAAISQDGRTVVFRSGADNLVANDLNNMDDIFVRNLDTGVTSRVSVASNGAEADSASEYPSISGDGRYVCFNTWATNLTPGDTNGASDVFLHDRQTGQTVLVSKSPTGGPATGGGSVRATVSDDGRFVAFESGATNLVVGDTDGFDDIFVHDRQIGSTVRASLTPSGTQPDRPSYRSSISEDGTVVCFQTEASDIVPGDTNGLTDCYVRAYGPWTLRVRSANPNSGVPMTVWTTDLGGFKNGSTSFDRHYGATTAASVTAPLQVGTQWFERWEVDGGTMPGGQRTLSVSLGDHTVRAIYLTGRTLTVGSSNPDTGVPITVYTTDKNGLRNGSTQFVRTYTQGTQVSLTAPATVGTHYLRRWDLDGSPWVATPTVIVPMSGNRTLVAVYGAGVVLSVESNAASVPIIVWTRDRAGLTNGTTAFTRLYAPGQAVALSAPATAGGVGFKRWERDGTPIPGPSRTVTVAMDAAHTLTAVYGP